MWPLYCNASKIYIAMAADISPLMKMLHKMTLERLLKAVTSLKTKQTDSLSHGTSLVKRRDAATWWITRVNPRASCSPGPGADCAGARAAPDAAPRYHQRRLVTGTAVVPYLLPSADVSREPLLEISVKIWFTAQCWMCSLQTLFEIEKEKIHITDYYFHVLKLR